MEPTILKRFVCVELLITVEIRAGLLKEFPTENWRVLMIK